MSAPDNTPPSCPRRADETSGPRKCGEETCPLHLRTIRTGRGGPAHPVRRELQRELDDTCSLDVAERARAAGVVLSYREIGVLLGCSHSAAEQTARKAALKLRVALVEARIVAKPPSDNVPDSWAISRRRFA